MSSSTGIQASRGCLYLTLYTDARISDSWLARQQRKRKRRTCICWIFWICFLIFIAAVVGVVIWGVQTGLFDNMPNANPNGGSMRRSIIGRSVIQSLPDLRGGEFPTDS